MEKRGIGVESSSARPAATACVCVHEEERGGGGEPPKLACQLCVGLCDEAACSGVCGVSVCMSVEAC